MHQYGKELTPVIYDSSALKILHIDLASQKTCFRAHWHDRMEILRIHSGELWVECSSKLHRVTAGHTVIIPPHTPHKGYTADHAVDYDVLMFDIRSFYNSTEVCQEYFPALYDGRAKLKNISDSPKLLNCLDKICRTAPDSRNYLEITADLYRLIYLLFEDCLVSFDAKTNTNRMAKEFTKYIEEHYDSDLTTASLSAHFGYTTSHFCRKFKEATGLTPSNYINIYRVEKAYKLLKEGKHNISSVAAQCGFPDANYFTRCFKAHFGVPPTHYVRK